MSSFFGFNVAVTGLLTSQKALDTVNHNIVNSAREGYSKQVVDMDANMPLSLPSEGMLGTGVNITDITRTRDEYLDYKYWSENQKGGEWDTKNTSLSEIQTLFNEPGNTGIRQVMDDFYSALQDLTKNPSDDSYRGALREKSITFTKTLNSMSQSLLKEQSDIDSEVGAKVNEINSLGQQIATLDKQIFSLELDGHEANDLRDQRTVLIDNLSKITNIEVKENIDPTTNMKKMSIKIGGIPLVDHTDFNGIELQKNKPNQYNTNASDPYNGEQINPNSPYLYSIKWNGTNQNVDIQQGELKGLLDVRDGDGQGSNYRGVVYYIRRLDEFASNFAYTFNKQHEKGYTNETTPENNVDFFSGDGSTNTSSTLSDYNKHVKAYNITLSDDVMNNLDKIAASDTSGSGEKDNNNNILALINQRNNTTFFNSPGLPQGSPDDFIKAVLSSMSVDAQQASRMQSNQDTLVKQVDTSRMATSSVDTNEELANAIKYQHTYQASAKMINVMDEIYDTIINSLGTIAR